MTWDKGVGYESVKTLLLYDYMRLPIYPQRAYLAISLIQLENGSRISEAIRAWKLFLQYNGAYRNFEVKLSKRRDKAMRVIVIPDYIEYPNVDPHEMRRLRRISRNAVGMFLLRTYNLNTHSLRYSFVSKMARKGVNPLIIAKITGHKNLNMLLTYTQKVEAVRTLLSEVGSASKVGFRDLLPVGTDRLFGEILKIRESFFDRDKSPQVIQESGDEEES